MPGGPAALAPGPVRRANQASGEHDRQRSFHRGHPCCRAGSHELPLSIGQEVGSSSPFLLPQSGSLATTLVPPATRAGPPVPRGGAAARRDLATRTAPEVISSSVPTSLADRPSTVVRQNACQVRSSNSPRISSSARQNSACSAAASVADLFRDRGRQAGHPLPGVGAARSARLPALPAEMVADLVARDRPQPAAERVALLLLAEAAEVAGHRPEHVLEDVRGVLRRQVAAAAPVKHQRSVQGTSRSHAAGSSCLDPLQQAPRSPRGGLAIRHFRVGGRCAHDARSIEPGWDESTTRPHPNS